MRRRKADQGTHTRPSVLLVAAVTTRGEGDYQDGVGKRERETGR